MIRTRTVACLGLGQLIAWGVSYYLIGVFEDDFAAAFGWRRGFVHAGYALALGVMALASPLAGRWVARHGGRRVLMAGGLLNAAGCAGLASCQGEAGYLLAWLVLGLGMRLSLYDAAFATLAALGGPRARPAMAQITLLGGLASTVCWPLGHALAEAWGWRVALGAFAGLSLLTLPLHLSLPRGVSSPPAPATAAGEGVGRPSSGLPAREAARAAWLYAVVTSGVNFLNAGMSAHMVGMLAGLGLAGGAAVGAAAWRGIGQSSARLGEVLFGKGLAPARLNLLAGLALPAGFLLGWGAGASALSAGIFAFVYGAANGLMTITRGTLPLVLFDARSYAERVGRLVAPSFVCSALAPLAYAGVMEAFGAQGALWLSLGGGLVVAAAGVGLYRLAGTRR